MRSKPSGGFALLAAAVVCLCGTAAHAATVTFTDTSLGGSEYLFNYTVAMAPSDPTYQELTIYLGETSFTNPSDPSNSLSNPNAPAGWSPTVAQPIPSLGPGPDNGDGFYDVLAVSAPGFAPGSTLTGFSVEAFYGGAGQPTAPQYYTFVDPNSFAVLASGNASPSPVPVPAALWLLGSGLLPLAGVTARRRKALGPVLNMP